jgi:hypothetical protein
MILSRDKRLLSSDRPKAFLVEYSAGAAKNDFFSYFVTFNFKAIFVEKINIYLTMSMFYALYVFVAHKS